MADEWLTQQTDIKLTAWPPQAPDMKPIKNMWSEVKKTMQETRSEQPRRNRDDLWTLASDAQDEVASPQYYVRSLIEYMLRQIRSVVDSQGFWMFY